MKKIVMGVMVLFFMSVITLVPLSAKAEMQAMTENEMEMVTAQITISQILGGALEGVRHGLSHVDLDDEFTEFLYGVYNTKLVKPLVDRLAESKLVVKLVNTEIPFTREIPQ